MAVDTATGPSSSRVSASRGTGTTTADQTVSDSPPVTPDARETTLPIPHERAANTQRAMAAAVTWPPRPTPTTSSPTVPSAMPATWAAWGRSRSTPAAITTVKMTCACSTSAARPGGMPAAIER
jgi:hypothetical protein